MTSVCIGQHDEAIVPDRIEYANVRHDIHDIRIYKIQHGVLVEM